MTSFRRQLRSNVATDLPHPDTLCLYGECLAPYTQMIAQADVVTSLLQGNVLWSPKNVKRANRRGRVLRSEHESADRSQYAVNIERLIKPPSRSMNGKIASAPLPTITRLSGSPDLLLSLLDVQQGSASSLARRPARSMFSPAEGRALKSTFCAA